jgi:hypothetical protein
LGQPRDGAGLEEIRRQTHVIPHACMEGIVAVPSSDVNERSADPAGRVGKISLLLRASDARG